MILTIDNRVRIRVDNNGNYMPEIYTITPEHTYRDKVIPHKEEWVHTGTYHGDVAQALKKAVLVLSSKGDDESVDALEYLKSITSELEKYVTLWKSI